MKYGSVCSGVEAATVAWHPLGWQPQWFSEIEAFPSAVLAHHYPNVPNLGDMTAFKEWSDDPIDLLVGGTPCQSFSVAGLRKGLDDPRGNLMLTYLAIAERYQPRWLVWENVTGVLSSNRGRDFGTFLAALGQIGYGFAYRVLDAQYFGVAQRRRRVFVVGYLGDWRRAAAVLFERESMSGHPAPSREAGEKAAPTVTSGAPFSRTGNQRVETDALVAKCLTRGVGQRYDPETETLPVAFSRTDNGRDATNNLTPTMRVAGRAGGTLAVAIQAQALKEKQPASQGFGIDESGTSYTLTAGDRHAVAFDAYNQTVSDKAAALRTAAGGVYDNTVMTPAVAFTASAMANSYAWERDVYPTLNAQVPNDTSNIQYGVRMGPQVRRLTPIECERLQGFPDDYTLIEHRNKPAADGPRYKAMGNSMAVPVMRWIGERIQMVEEMT